MSRVVLLRGLNVGGHRRFRPTTLASQLRHLGAINIGAAGTIVIREPVSAAHLRGEVARLMPFAAEIVICRGSQIARLLAHGCFAGQPLGRDVVGLVSVLSRRPRAVPRLPLTLPRRGRWLLKVFACDGPFILGMYRRHMRVIGYLGALDRLYGVPVITRSWTTMTAIARACRDS